jgi:hypothetical protein
MGQRVRAFAGAGALVLAQATWSPLAAQGDLEPLLARARAASGRRDYPAAIDALQKALEQVRRAAPLAVEKFMVVQEPAKSYGAYVPRKNAEFRANEELHFYLEPKNLVYPKSADGTYRPAFDVGFEIVDKDGATVAKQERFGSFQFASKSALQDIYVNLHLTIEGAPAGTYDVRFTVKDTNSDKTATVTQTFKVV